MKRLMADPVHVDGVLADGAARAATIAGPVIAEVKKILGFVRSRGV
jgi:tryptophanyl-tRNA synthetase